MFMIEMLMYLLFVLVRYASNPSANISGLCKSSLFKVADFSYNFFEGRVPSCLDYLPMYFL